MAKVSAVRRALPPGQAVNSADGKHRAPPETHHRGAYAAQLRASGKEGGGP
jgi:hypothetical protein